MLELSRLGFCGIWINGVQAGGNEGWRRWRRHHDGNRDGGSSVPKGEHRSGSGVSGVCLKRALVRAARGTLSKAPHVGLRVAFAEAERYIKVCSRKAKRMKFQQLIDRGTLVVGKAQGRRSNC